MNNKLGKEVIQELLRNAVSKCEKDTGKTINCNQTPGNYQSLTGRLNEISNELPKIYPDEYKADSHGTYNINNTQIRDAYHGKVEHLKDHLHKALLIYIGDKPSDDKGVKLEYADTDADPIPIIDNPTELLPKAIPEPADDSKSASEPEPDPIRDDNGLPLLPKVIPEPDTEAGSEPEPEPESYLTWLIVYPVIFIFAFLLVFFLLLPASH